MQNSPLTINLKNCATISDAALYKYNLTCDRTYNLTATFFNFYMYNQKTSFMPDLLNPFGKKVDRYVDYYETTKFKAINVPLGLNFLEDDRGWILSDVKNITDVSFLPPVTTTQPFPVNFPFLTIRFYTSDYYKTYNRSYLKMQDLLASIGGFMKLIFTLLNLCNLCLRTYLIDEYLYEKIFGNSHEPKGKQINNSVDLSQTQGNNLIDNTKNLFNNYVDVGAKSERLKGIKNDNIDNKTNIELCKASTADLTKKIKYENKHHTFCQYLRALLLNSCGAPKKKKADSAIQILRNKLSIVDKTRDFDYILSNISKLNKFMKLFFNKEQIISMEYLKQPECSVDKYDNLPMPCLLDTKEEKRSMVIDYFYDLHARDVIMNDIDEYLYKRLDDVVIKDIMSRVTKKKNGSLECNKNALNKN